MLYLHLYFEKPVIHGHLISTSIYIEESYEIKIGDVGCKMNVENVEVNDLFDSNAIGDEA